MFYVIPTSNNSVRTNTPIGVKSIRYIYFENKNDGLFKFKDDADRISIEIDGKLICNNLLVLPFCTSTPNARNRFRWEDVALETPINVNYSEIKISAATENDYNVVFVCSDQEVDETKGFDYFETKELALKSTLTMDQAYEIVCAAYNKAFIALKNTLYNQLVAKNKQYEDADAAVKYLTSYINYIPFRDYAVNPENKGNVMLLDAANAFKSYVADWEKKDSCLDICYWGGYKLIKTDSNKYRRVYCVKAGTITGEENGTNWVLSWEETPMDSSEFADYIDEDDCCTNVEQFVLAVQKNITFKLTYDNTETILDKGSDLYNISIEGAPEYVSAPEGISETNEFYKQVFDSLTDAETANSALVELTKRKDDLSEETASLYLEYSKFGATASYGTISIPIEVVYGGETYKFNYCNIKTRRGKKLINQTNAASLLISTIRSKRETYWGVELNYLFDKEPRFFFATQYTKPKNSDYLADNDIKLNISFSGSDNEIIPPKTDLDIVSCNSTIPMRDCIYEFEESSGVRRSINVVISPNKVRNIDNSSEIEHISKKDYDTEFWRLYLLFGYKKLI